MGVETSEDVLIELLSEYLGNRNDLHAEITQEVISLATAHQVLPIIYYQTKDKRLQQDYLKTIHSYTQRKKLLNQIKDAFFEIPFYTVKGLSVSTYYPVPQLRTMGDCDIIVHKEDKEKAKKILLSIGFRYVETKWDSTEWHFEKQGLDFELHHRLLYEEDVNREQEKAFADTAWDYVRDHELDVNFHFVFMLLHLKKHLLNRGAGIRQFMDLAVIAKNVKLDPKIIALFLKRVGLEKFAGVCSALCLRWFGVAFPVEKVEVSDDFFVYATNAILSNGVFGFENSDNKEKRLINNIRKRGKIGAVIYKFFPPYEGCAGTIKYKWIKGKPYLMPVLWLYRPIEFLLSGKINEGFSHIFNVVNSDEALSERNKILSEWGL